MFCPNCGAKIESEAKFCMMCGAKIPTAAQEATTYIEEPAAATEEVCEAQVCADNNVSFEDCGYRESALETEVSTFDVKAETRKEIKKLAGGGLVLAVAILLSLGALISLLSSFGAANWFGQIANFLYEMDAIDSYAYYFVLQVQSAISSLSVAGTFIGNIPNILIIIGLWIIFGTAAKKENLCPTTTGITLIKVAVVINMVCTLIVSGLLTILGLVGTIGGAIASGEAYYYNSAASAASAGVGAISVIIFIVAAIALAFGIVYYVKLLKTLKALRSSVSLGEPNANVSRFITFICFFTGCVGALGVFNVVGVMNSVATILCGVLLVMYKNRMEAVRSSRERLQ